MKLSAFGEKFTRHSGILSLMDDLGNALADGHEMIMMGGGNPAHIPEVEAVFNTTLQQIHDDKTLFTRLTGTYDPPQGEKRFIKELAAFLNRHYGWKISERNIAITNGSQTAFFMLFNMFAGRNAAGEHQTIQLPMAPEYIGYADTGLGDDFFRANKPEIDFVDAHVFKYRVNFDQLTLDNNVGALCVSRPTNPTGNVITDAELERLDALAAAHNIPLIIDGAYGLPFPNLIFSDATVRWSENTVLCLSLSKLGLPAARTGIVIANEEIIQTLSGMNAIMSLAPTSFGPMLVTPLLQDDRILHLSNNLIRPYYQQRAQFCVDYLKRIMGDLPWAVHKPEGAMFLWLWFKDLPISSLELYHRLKAKGLLAVSGHYFFPGIEADWTHQHQCLRITYTREQATLERGLQIIADEVRSIYQG